MNNDEINKLFKNTKQNTGIDINEMKKAAKQGNMDDFLNKSLSHDAAKKLKNVLSNKEATEKLLSTPQAKELMKKLMEGK